MAAANVIEVLSANDGLMGATVAATVRMKRKTPSELRGEQMKRKFPFGGDQLPPMEALDRGGSRGTDVRMNSGEQKIPKYVNTRVTEIFPVMKSSKRCNALHGKESQKDDLDAAENASCMGFIRPTFPKSDDKITSLHSGNDPSIQNQSCDRSFKALDDQSFRKIEKCSQQVLRNVVELHLGNENLGDATNIDMKKALRGLVNCDVSSSSLAGINRGSSCDAPSTSPNLIPTEICVPGKNAPIDFTLKSAIQLVTSSSVKWCHRISSSFACDRSISHFTSEWCNPSTSTIGCGSLRESEILFSKALQSWVYPQSSLPSSIISAMASSTAKAEMDFLCKRQKDWEDSFGCLYYMLRKNLCNIFYVCTTQFVVLFIGGKFIGKKMSCNAYVSQSTRGLRSLLRKYDVSFSMPLCCGESEQVSEDDLVELSEIANRNLGQTVHLDSSSDVDSTPQSLLAFTGNERVHALYDFLLNYRSFLSSLCSMDVPSLHSPVAFQNASIHVPEVRCKEVRKADSVAPSMSGSDSEHMVPIVAAPAGNLCYSIEVKDTVLPPWVITGLCAAFRSAGDSFDSTFTLNPSSMGLNVAVESMCGKADAGNSSLECWKAIGISEAVFLPSLRSVSLRRLIYADNVYTGYTTV